MTNQKTKHEIELTIDEGYHIDKLNYPYLQIENDRIVLVSAKYRSGLEELEKALLDHVNLKPLEDHDVIVTNARHYDALARVQEAVIRVMGGLDTGISGDFLSQDIREILHYLGEISGEITTDEILGNIFASFCIGK